MPVTDLIPWRRKEPIQREEERPWGGGHPLSILQRDMNRLFDEFFRGFDLAPFGGEWTAFSPHVDIAETDKEIVVSAELPGLDDKDIDVSLSHDTLTIRGEKKEEKEEKGRSYYRTERSYGSFVRSVPLPADVNPDKVDAVFRKGVLTITLAKTGEARAGKRITVKT